MIAALNRNRLAWKSHGEFIDKLITEKRYLNLFLCCFKRIISFIFTGLPGCNMRCHWNVFWDFKKKNVKILICIILIFKFRKEFHIFRNYLANVKCYCLFADMRKIHPTLNWDKEFLKKGSVSNSIMIWIKKRFGGY